MAGENGGEISVGQRLARIETRLDGIEEHLDARISRHKKANEDQMKELATSIIKDFGNRITVLEKKEVAEDAKNTALDAAKEEARSNKRWVIGSAISLGVLLLMCVGLLFQLLGEVH